MRTFILGVIALSLVACATPGAGTTQNPCGLAQVQEAAPTGLAQQQQQALDAGQKAYNQPSMSDPAKWSPGTTWGGGAGAVDADNEWWEERNLAGAPNSLQCLVQPASQEQNQSAGVHPRLLSLERQIEAANERLCAARAMGDQEAAKAEYDLIKDLNKQYAQATVDTAKNVTNNYHFDGAYITQGTSNSSTGSGKPGKASTTGDGTEVQSAPTAAEIVKSAGAPAPVEPDSPRDPAPVEPE